MATALVDSVVDIKSSNDLRASTIEENITKINELVLKKGGLGASSSLTESQNAKLMGYLGSIDGMKKKIAIMINRYQEDEKVLSRLLNLYDRLDEVIELHQMVDGANKAPAPPTLKAREAKDKGKGKEKVYEKKDQKKRVRSTL
eukprot:TRINITY_DN1994_c0_g2_i1.p1 TRINITY_DN1994_c0_g2~~TRINITY_DN1994_c0_g2_i1.p1  ORF type:complete len:144 (+),score=39.40 TRINITY_DN1994_c0_g2_i1:274-705(+)